MTRAAMWALLGTVAIAAAVLSFAALTALAELCGFSEQLSWLLPVVVDAGAAAGCLTWLGASAPAKAQRFARTLTFVLLASSVAGNAVVHGLSAYRLAPPWWLVVAVSGIAPAVLGAIVHLAVLVGRTQPQSEIAPSPVSLPVEGLVRESRAATGAVAPPPAPVPVAPTSELGNAAAGPKLPGGSLVTPDARALIAAGAGRRRLSRDLGISEHEARVLLEQAKTNGHPVLTEAR